MTNSGDTTPGDDAPRDHGTYTLVAATPLTIPTMTKGVIDWFTPAPPSDTATAATLGAKVDAKVVRDYTPILRSRIAKRYLPPACPYYKLKAVRKPPVPPPPPPPPVSAVGVMDVGIGNCNMLLDQNLDPMAYYDVGLPLFFYGNSAPAGLRAPAWAGPILNNHTTGVAVPVILSHWDWDHWRLGRVANMQNHAWLIPHQARGPAANNFLHTLTNVVVYGGAPATVGAGYMIFQCNPAGAAVGAFLLNNSGLALRMDILLPTADATVHSLYLTADANFSSLPFPAAANTTAIVTVHHGSNNHGAAADLPAQAAGYVNNGRIAYSYGVRLNGTHPYGFPVAQTVTAYHNAGWTQVRSTAEGPNINHAPPAVGGRGNIRMGNPVGLNPAAYGATAFFAFPNGIN